MGTGRAGWKVGPTRRVSRRRRVEGGRAKIASRARSRGRDVVDAGGRWVHERRVTTSS